MNNSHLHPVFSAILASIEQQPLQLHRAAVKSERRRFLEEPEAPSAFAGLDEFVDDRTYEERAEDERYHFQEMCDADDKLGDQP